MKVNDPLAGLRAGSGDPVIHMTFFISILILDRQDADLCEKRGYGTALNLLLTAHILSAPILFLTMSRMCCKLSTDIMERSLKFVALIVYGWAIFYAQDVLFFDNPLPMDSQCLLDEGHFVLRAQQWLIIEVLQFYQGFFTATIFACLAKVFQKKHDHYIMTGNQPDDSQKNDDLFIEASFTFDMFSQYFNPLLLTIAITYYSYSEDLEDSYAWVLVVMLTFHAMQAIFTLIFIYGFEWCTRKHNSMAAGCMCCCICCTPFILLICQIVALASVGQNEDALIFTWVLNDTLICTLSMMIFVYRVWENDKMKRQLEKDADALEEQQKKLDLSASKRAVEIEEAAEAMVGASDQLQIDHDFYTIAFVSFIKFNQIKYKISRSDLADIMYNVLFVFGMQMILIGLIGESLANSDLIKVRIEVAAARFICAYLLHFSMEGSTRQSLALFKYFLNHSNNLKQIEPEKPKEPEYEPENTDAATSQNSKKNEEQWADEQLSSGRAERQESTDQKPFTDTVQSRNAELRKKHDKLMEEYDIEFDKYSRATKFYFNHRMPPLLICMMQIISSSATEVINILVICQQASVMDVVMNYIALEIVAQIDNLYSETVQSRIVQEIMDDENWRPYIIWDRKKNLPLTKRKFWNCTLHFVYRISKLFYVSFYYYFFPLVVIILTYFTPNVRNCETDFIDGDEQYCGPGPDERRILGLFKLQ